MVNEEEVTEKIGAIKVDGKVRYHVLVCTACGACVTVTQEQRVSRDWIGLAGLAKIMTCCSKPDYYFGDLTRFYA